MRVEVSCSACHEDLEGITFEGRRGSSRIPLPFIVHGIETNFPPWVTPIESVAQRATKPSYQDGGDTRQCSCFDACCTQPITNIWLFGATSCSADHIEEDTGVVKYVWDRGPEDVCN